MLLALTIANCETVTQFNSLKQYDVVITTYGVVAMEWPQLRKKGKKDPFDKEDDDKEYQEEERRIREEMAQINLMKGELFKVCSVDTVYYVKRFLTFLKNCCLPLSMLYHR
jgi:regulator of replication initiation timing